MKTTGRLADIHLSLQRKLVISFEVAGDPEIIEGLKDKELDINVKEHKEKRSLDANSYYWVLLMQLARALRTSKDELHEIMLRRYSVPFLQDDERPVIVGLKENIPVTALPGHWIRRGRKGDVIAWMRILGSSEMDTSQMSYLLDGLISECKAQGIETATPEELERMRGYEKQAGYRQRR